MCQCCAWVVPIADLMCHYDSHVMFLFVAETRRVGRIDCASALSKGGQAFFVVDAPARMQAYINRQQRYKSKASCCKEQTQLEFSAATGS